MADRQADVGEISEILVQPRILEGVLDHVLN